MSRYSIASVEGLMHAELSQSKGTQAGRENAWRPHG